MNNPSSLFELLREIRSLEIEARQRDKTIKIQQQKIQRLQRLLDQNGIEDTQENEDGGIT